MGQSAGAEAGLAAEGTSSGREAGPVKEGDKSEASRLTGRAFLVGLVLCVLLGLWLPYYRMVIQGGHMNLYLLDRGAIFAFFCLALIANPILAAVRRRLALKKSELASVYIMLLLLLPASIMIRYAITFTTGVRYYASPERRGLDAVLPHTQPWMSPQDSEVVRGLYEGIPDEAGLPWQAWLAPLASWGFLLMALFGVILCLAVLLRKQWEDHERFVFPLMQVPLEMSVRDEGVIGPLFRHPLTWVGFGLVFLVGTIRALHNYYYFVPTIELGTQLLIFRQTTPLPFRLHFSLLGYSYFVNLDVSLSIWLFNLISKFIRGGLAVFGVEYTDVSGTIGRFSSRGSAFLAFMGMGYIVALAVYTLWVARGHLRQVAARILGKISGADDREEVVSYRTAAMGIVLGVLYVGCWLYQGGISVPLILFLFLASFVVFLVLARIVSEAGFAATYSPLNPWEFVVCSVGSSAFNRAGLVTLGFSYAWTMTRYNTLWPRAAGALRLAREIACKRWVLWAMLAAFALGLITMSAMRLDIAYTHGGFNLDRDFHDRARLPFDEFVGRRMLEESPIFHRGFLYMAMGAALTAGLTAMRTRLTWWPLHPIALPLSTIWYTDTYFFSVFLAWAIKAAVLKVGGGKLYQSTRPFFIGLILGEAVCMGAWATVDYVTGTVGNVFY